MHLRRLRKLFHDPIWFVLLGAVVSGALAGHVFAREENSDAVPILLGKAWNADSTETRAVLGTIFGFLATIVALVLSLNGVIIKSASYQYSPRLVPLYLRNAPLRRALPVLAFLGAYLIAALRELGLLADDLVRPRFVVSGAVAVLFVGILFLVVELIRTFRFIRVERVLGLVRDATFAAVRRVRGRVDRLALDADASLELPLDATALVARSPGYLVDVHLRRLARIARNARVRARICHAIGDYVDEGGVIGWVASDDGRPVSAALTRELALTLVVSAVREIDYDPALGIRIIVDVANRALSSSVNDPYTARQALNQLRSVLRHVARLPLRDWNVVDHDGKVRVSVMAPRLRELLDTAVRGPLYYGADHPDVLEGLLELVLEVGWVARDAEDRDATRALLEKIDGLAEECELDPDRLERLRADAAPVRRALASSGPPHQHG
ncbi:MAG TPA: DUF2254 family protein [Polyangiaceae bacterium]|nr:DUF2254 family protein [Polyangiaceae bacterium]